MACPWPGPIGLGLGVPRRAAAWIAAAHGVAIACLLAGAASAAPCRLPKQSTAAHAAPAELLFSSGFAEDTALGPVQQGNCWPTGCWQSIGGTDSDTSRYTSKATWPPEVWQGDAKLQLLAGVPVTAGTIGDYMFHQIRTTTGHDGRPTRALYSEITRGPDGPNPIGAAATQASFQLLPVAESGDLYISFWIRFQPDLLRQMRNLPPGPGVDGGGTWRAFFEWKTGSPGADDGDYRVAAYVLTYGGGAAYWGVGGDNVAGGRFPLTNGWNVETRSAPVPVGAWFKFEAFWHRSGGADGRVWMAVDGHVIADRSGPNTGAARLGINRIFWNLYSGSRLPISQWVDDLQVWNGFPASACGDPWYDPPYAPH